MIYRARNEQITNELCASDSTVEAVSRILGNGAINARRYVEVIKSETGASDRTVINCIDYAAALAEEEGCPISQVLQRLISRFQIECGWPSQVETAS